MRDHREHNLEPIAEVSFDPTETRPTTAVLDALSDLDGVDPMSARPLAEVVDPDAIDALVESDGGSNPVRVVFEYEGYAVHVTGGGCVEISGETTAYTTGLNPEPCSTSESTD